MNTAPSTTTPVLRSVGMPRLTDRRKTTLVNRRYQLRAGAMTTMLTLCLLIPMNVGLYSARQAATGAILESTPGVAAMLAAQDRYETLLVLMGSLLFLVIVFFVTLMVTQRTAGASFQIAQKMEDVREGRYDTRVRLRDKDNLVELEEAFNAMASILEDRTWRDIEKLEELALAAEQADTPEARAALAARLIDRAAHRRRLVDPSVRS